MARQTVLEMTQEILSDMNSDEVNSITDTEEAMQVARIIKRTFLNLVNDRVWPAAMQIRQLIASGDSNKPTTMTMPDDVLDVGVVLYNVSDTSVAQWKEMVYEEPEIFMSRLLARDPSASNVATVLQSTGTPLFVYTDRSPTFYTTFNDKELIFDSYNLDVEVTLQTAKTQASVHVEPTFTLEDSFIPEMPTKFFPYLVSEAKSISFLKIKEVFSQPDAQHARQQKSWLGRNKHRAQHRDKLPDYGRRGGLRYQAYDFRRAR